MSEFVVDSLLEEVGFELPVPLRRGAFLNRLLPPLQLAKPVETGDIGEQSLKNIARPLRVYRIVPSLTTEQPTTPPIALPLPDKPSIAVLPFANMSGDPEQEYFADGMVEEIITALSRIR